MHFHVLQSKGGSIWRGKNVPEAQQRPDPKQLCQLGTHTHTHTLSLSLSLPICRTNSLFVCWRGTESRIPGEGRNEVLSLNMTKIFNSDWLLLLAQTRKHTASGWSDWLRHYNNSNTMATTACRPSPTTTATTTPSAADLHLPQQLVLNEPFQWCGSKLERRPRSKVRRPLQIFFFGTFSSLACANFVCSHVPSESVAYSRGF